MADTCQNPLIQVRLSLIYPLLLVRFVWGLKRIPRKMEITCPSLATFGQRSGQKVIDEQPNARQLLFNHIFVRKSHTMGLLLLFYQGICVKPHANLTSINGNINT